jgi:hypothetical protein
MNQDKRKIESGKSIRGENSHSLIGIQLFQKSEAYYKNYDRINWHRKEKNNGDKAS